MGGFVVGMVRFSLLRLLILPLRQLIFMRILDVCFSYIISRPRYTCYVPSYAYQPIERDWSKAWMKPNWLFWILKCVFLPLPGRRLLRMDDPRSDSPHREECTSLVILSLLRTALVILSLLRATRWVSQAVHILFRLTSSVLFSLYFFTHSILISEADTKKRLST